MTDFTTSFQSITLGRYQIQERLGAGGMARVYKAWDTNLDRLVAIKILHEHLADDPTFKERFEREAKFVAGFNHPNIVQVYDFDSVERDGQRLYYMVMSYVPGKSLATILEEAAERQERLPHKRVLEIMLNLTSALGYAHERGMVHRDVKPSNVMMDEHDQAVLTDFGIARLVLHSNLTQEGIAVGTPAYMSPEQVAGGAVDARSDLYALGIILYEMLAGKTPFENDGSLSVLLKHLNEPVPLISQFLHVADPFLDAIVLRALAKNADDRYQTAQDFAEDLKSAFAGQAVSTPTQNFVIASAAPSAASRSSGNVRRSPLGIFAAGMAVISMLLFVALLSQRNQQAPASNPSNQSSADSMTGELFFTSTFASDDPLNTDWAHDSAENVARDFTSAGFYHIANHQPKKALTSLFDPGYTYHDATISMTAALTSSSSPASGYGVVFRYTDEEHYNVFAVDGVGRYSIWVRKDGKWTELRRQADTWSENAAVQRIGKTNKLTLDIDGNQLTGYVNDTMVVTLSDNSFSSGSVGIYLASTNDGNTDLKVDSYQVKALEKTGVDAMTAEETEVPTAEATSPAK